MTRFTLRPYQQEAVDATLRHFRQTDESAVIVLPTGAGKSLVIAELAKLAKRKILVLAHVKELVEQNFQKYQSYGLQAGIFSAGLKQKDTDHQVTFASIQSVARNLAEFNEAYSLLIIDECHRVSGDDESQYGQLIETLKESNANLKVLGLTATPYRMGLGWIYQYHYRGIVRSEDTTPFVSCIYELPLRYMIKNQFLTPPNLIDATIAHYDFSALFANSGGGYVETEVNSLLSKNKRVTKSITEQVIEKSHDRQGVMIFASTVKHAEEILSYLPESQALMVTGDTHHRDRDSIISAFKTKKIKYLVNVSVLTTGFDAPHVDFIAILRPTESVSLYQQIIGRGLRLSDGKSECLVIDYAGNDLDLFQPEVGKPKPSADTEPVQVFCPLCGFANIFWGKTDDDGSLIEHYGRKCQGMEIDEEGERQCCDYRFRFKACPHCGAENDIAARSCHQCHEAVVDPDDKLKAALQLKDALILRCAGISLFASDNVLAITYHDEHGDELKQRINFAIQAQKNEFNSQFGRRHKDSSEPKVFNSAKAAAQAEAELPHPDFVVARKSGQFWRVRELIFDYQGNYRKANELN